MQMQRWMCVLALPVLFSACGKDQATAAYDEAKLAEARAAVPSKTQMSAEAPGASTRAAGATAMFPKFGVDVAAGVNGAVSGIVDLMARIVEIPPTRYKSDTQEFFWGPWKKNDPDDTFGYVAAYVRENPLPRDFKYTYALLRGPDEDESKLVPIIWGSATPDPTEKDYGTGVTLWDFEANYLFAKTDPAFVSKPYDRGRFVALYGRQVDKNDAAAVFAFNVAVFNGFVPKDKPTTAAVHAEYLYGKWVKADLAISFLDFRLPADVVPDAAQGGPDGKLEDMKVRMAAINRGVGRAEITLTNHDPQDGSYPSGKQGEATECWNAGIDETYLRFAQVDSTSGVADWNYEKPGTTASDCGVVFSKTLDELKIPSIDSVDAEFHDGLTKMRDVAANGVPR